YRQRYLVYFLGFSGTAHSRVSMSANYFAGRLKELREQAGLNQQELAERAGMSKGGIANLEQGRTKPAWDSVLALAAALGVSCEAFQAAPASRPEPQRGRPPKPTPDAPTPKRPRGLPRKGSETAARQGGETGRQAR